MIRYSPYKQPEVIELVRQMAQTASSWTEITKAVNREFGFSGNTTRIRQTASENGIVLVNQSDRSKELQGSFGGESNELCFRCKNAVPKKDGSQGCNWSRKLQPVDGWTADLSVITNHGKRGAVSYLNWHITDCPEFVRG